MEEREWSEKWNDKIWYVLVWFIDIEMNRKGIKYLNQPIFIFNS